MNITSEILHLAYSSSLSDLCEVNSSFDHGVLRIAYTGKNRNGSYISKKTFEKCIDTLYNCPVVCNYDRETDSIGGHDMGVFSNDNGDMKLVNLTIPVGVIPESSKYFWETVTEPDGSEHEYLCADVLLWKRQEAYEKIKRDGVTAHSMEISVKSGATDGDTFVINDFEFTAFCLLGDDYEPCFESSALAMFSYDGLKKQMNEMMSELKSSFSLINKSQNPETIITEGGEKVLEDKLALAAEYGIEVSGLDFSIDDFSVEELREKFESMKEQKEESGNEEPHDGVEDGVETDVDDANFALNSQINEELRRELSTITVEREWGTCLRYSLADIDVEKKEVYFWDSEEDWKLFGAAYVVDGDSYSIDFESKKRMRFAIVEFDEGDQDSPIPELFNTMDDNCKQFKSKMDEMTEKFNTASATIDELNAQIQELTNFKTEVEASERRNSESEIFSRFEDLEEIEEFKSLKNSCANMSLEDLEEKCFAIRGKNSKVPAKFTLEGKSTKLKVDRDTSNNEPYGGLFVRYAPGE